MNSPYGHCNYAIFHFIFFVVYPLVAHDTNASKFGMPNFALLGYLDFYKCRLVFRILSDPLFSVLAVCGYHISMLFNCHQI